MSQKLSDYIGKYVSSPRFKGFGYVMECEELNSYDRDKPQQRLFVKVPGKDETISVDPADCVIVGTEKPKYHYATGIECDRLLAMLGLADKAISAAELILDCEKGITLLYTHFLRDAQGKYLMEEIDATNLLTGGSTYKLLGVAKQETVTVQLAGPEFLTNGLSDKLMTALGLDGFPVRYVRIGFRMDDAVQMSVRVFAQKPQLEDVFALLARECKSV